MSYLELLMALNTRGIRCEKEINQALKELHELMMPKNGVIATDGKTGESVYLDKDEIKVTNSKESMKDSK